jgi:hypothetical protein
MEGWWDPKEETWEKSGCGSWAGCFRIDNSLEKDQFLSDGMEVRRIESEGSIRF